MIKLLGAILVICGCSMIGWYFSGKYSNRIYLLEEWQQIMQYFYGEIEYAGYDMYEILQHLSERFTYSQHFWENIQQELCSHAGATFSEIWNKHVTEIELWNTLKNEDIDIIKEIGKNLGNLDRDTQLHTIQIFQNRICHNLSEAKGEYAMQAKLCHVMGITAGVFIAILLL